jgi:hypothetical protein
LNNQITNAFSIYSIERFIRNLYTIGGEFQKQQIALQAMIGDADKGNAIFERAKGLAVISPFTFSELSSYTKQMSAYGIEYEELYDTTKRLADISAGVGVDMGRLILAFGQVRSAAVLRGQELRQFTEAGIPLVAELAKRFTELEGKAVSTGEVFDKISKREVSFGMVKDILFDMTDPGGRFFKMQEEQAKSLAGQWSNLKDAWDIMVADIANASSGALGMFSTTIKGILDTWRAWSPVLLGVVGLIGTYSAAIRIAELATSALNLVTKANPWVKVISVVVSATSAIIGYQIASKDATKTIEDLNVEFEKSKATAEDNERTANRYLDILSKSTDKEDKETLEFLNKQIKEQWNIVHNLAQNKYELNDGKVQDYCKATMHLSYKDSLHTHIVQKLGKDLYSGIEKCIVAPDRILHYRKLGQTISFETKKNGNGIYYNKKEKTK